jgi:hypothetical protein
VVERSDEEMVGKLIERSRLLIAVSEEIPVAVKLETQPLLKELERMIHLPAEQQDEERIRATWGLLYEQLADYADLEALLGAMRNFISYL